MSSDFTIKNATESTRSYVAGATGIGTPRIDPTGLMARMGLRRPLGYVIESGIVIRSGVFSYDFEVKIGEFSVPCTMLRRQSTKGFGVADGEIPVEGSTVFVLLREGSHGTGWIIGVEPCAQHLVANGNQKVKGFKNYPTLDINPYLDNAAYNVPHTGKDYRKRIWASSELWSDILPGESFLTNENRCGIVTTMYDVELTGGASFIRISSIDDEVRIRATNFTKWTSAQAVKEFNDGGLISAEGRDYSYQGELLGDKGKSLSSPYNDPSAVKGKEPRPRTRWWRGFLGNLFSWFVVRAGKSREEEDTGLASVHVSQAGNVMVRAAGGVSLERYDAIPVPKRQKEEWDIEGDKEVDTTHSTLSAFQETDPHAVGLIKSSKMAWEQRAMYKRFDELKKDFKTPNEQDLKAPSSQDDDPFFSSELDLSKYKGRKAGVFVGDDGSVIIRDAWGSEIVMAGGNVCINTPGNVITTAHGNVVSIAGQGAILRGAKAAEMTSEDGQVRVHSGKLVEIAGGTDKSAGGVLIESLGSGSKLAAKKEAGDEARITGVIIKSEKGNVSVSGDTAYVLGKSKVAVTSGSESGPSRTGTVTINGGSVLMSAGSTAGMLVGGSACFVTKKTAVLCSDKGSAAVIGKTAAIISGKKIPVWWDAIDKKPDMSMMKSAWSRLQSNSVLGGYTWEKLKEQAVFSFRKAVQAKTNTGIEPWRPNGQFTLYQPYWQLMNEVGSELIKTSPTKLEVKEVHGSKCWPYKEAIESGMFITVSPGSLNIQKDGISKKRDSLNASVQVNKKSFSEFSV